jgi:hypothetical protein
MGMGHRKTTNTRKNLLGKIVKSFTLKGKPHEFIFELKIQKNQVVLVSKEIAT